jgi:hypothetical protein
MKPTHRLPADHAPRTPRRRPLLAAALAAPLLPLSMLLAHPAPARAQARDEPEALLRAGGMVVMLRHALAPGTFDPPGFRLGDCRTQRNLNDEGRAQARRIGAWFEARGLKPAAVRSSPWCRCTETAQLGFGRAEVWPALGSPVGSAETTNAENLQALRDGLARVAAAGAGFEVWVSHAFVQRALAGSSTGTGEALLLQWRSGAPALLARAGFE